MPFEKSTKKVKQFSTDEEKSILKYASLVVQLATYEKRLNKYETNNEGVIEISCPGRRKHIKQQIKRVKELIAKEETKK